jgi:hypothetical protein
MRLNQQLVESARPLQFLRARDAYGCTDRGAVAANPSLAAERSERALIRIRDERSRSAGHPQRRSRMGEGGAVQEPPTPVAAGALIRSGALQYTRTRVRGHEYVDGHGVKPRMRWQGMSTRSGLSAESGVSDVPRSDTNH